MRRALSVPAVVATAATAVLAACGGASSPPPTEATGPAPHAMMGPASLAPPPPPAREDGRLPATVTPQRYALELRIDPTRPRFRGVTAIQVEVTQPTWHVVLHARDMNVSGAVARAGGVPITATPTMRIAHAGVVPEELVLTFAQPLPPGTVQIDIAYDAPFSNDLAGLYRVQENGAWYAYTQFEATDARRAFPCFDEPGFKTAYDVTIVSPPGTIALSNAPESRGEPQPDGMVAHHFETTRPLPSYLVAFAIGDFDVVQGQTSPFPIRAVTTKGRGGLTGLALEAAAALIAKLGEYFDVRYPYAKLDLVAVPDFAAGAMENPGLVTFRDQLLLLDPQHATTSTKRAQAEVIAHEFAHQWFGDLVTAQWWDDIWLNEGFATWAEAKMVDAWRPSFGAKMQQIAGVQRVMDTDALKSARAVREPVHSTSEVMESFDGLTYEKGAAVLRMLESWLGPDTFRRGVQRYIHDNAWKNARADDLFKALDFVSAQKVGELASGFLDRPGVPSVLVSWKCGGKDGMSQVELRESEWRPLGAGGEPARTWTLPVCVASDAQKSKSCFTLGAQPIARQLGARCPTWVYPNAEEAGYYRFVLDRPQLLALTRGGRTLDAADRLGLVSNAWAAVRQGSIDPGTLLDMLKTFDVDDNRLVVEQVTEVLRAVDRALVDDGDRAAFQRYALARLAAKKAVLGWEPRKGVKEDEERALERRDVLRAMGELARDAKTLAEAEAYTARWLKDPTSVPADTAQVAVPLSSLTAGPARLDELRAAAKSARTPEDRALAIRAMGTFGDPALLRRGLDLALGEELRLSELRYLFWPALVRPEAAPVFFAWEKEHWAELRRRIPGSLGRGMLVGVAGALCTRAQREEAQVFFAGATQGIEGVKRALDEGLEEAGLCVALRDHGAADVRKYLERK
jgi:aminopeptidase N